MRLIYYLEKSCAFFERALAFDDSQQFLQENAAPKLHKGREAFAGIQSSAVDALFERVDRHLEEKLQAGFATVQWLPDKLI